MVPCADGPLCLPARRICVIITDALMKEYVFRHVECTRSPVCGLAMLNPGWCHMSRLLENETVLIFGRKNSTLIDAGGEILEVRPGRMVILPARILHRGAEPVKIPVSYWWVHFYQVMRLEDETRYFMPRTVDNSADLGDDSIVLPSFMDVRNPMQYANLFSELLSRYEHPGFSPMVYHSLVERLLLAFAEEYHEQSFESSRTQASQTATPVLVRKILELIEDELSNPDASVKYFASALKLNPDYLGRCFKEVMETSIGQYIQKRRVELACSRLRETSASVEEVASQCGFGSRRQFYEEFRRFTGKTPSVYRSESAYVGVNAL